MAKYLMAYLAETVFPAPDSPDTIMDWLRENLQIERLAGGEVIFFLVLPGHFTESTLCHAKYVGL